MGKGENVCLKHTMTFRGWGKKKGTRGFTQKGGTTADRLWTGPQGKGRFLQNLTRAVPAKLCVVKAGLQTRKREIRDSADPFLLLLGRKEEKQGS